MIIGIGTDILDINRLRRCPEDLLPDAPFLIKTYTAAERAAAEERPDKIAYLATRFAGKEAVFKALGIGGDRIRLNEIEILNDGDGRPQVTLTGRMKELADRCGVLEVKLSLSYENDYAIAFAIMQK
ncbi:MAG: holo-ACP synthase [Saccharofermentanales bacterium]|jgi:holo-[acyl-carrier protein] synthase|nr:holo-ACP synthase [Clostridiaceae bacterium]